MTIPATVTQIAVGSSSDIWMLDQPTNTVYARNPLTREFVAIDPGAVQIASIDVSHDGHVLALDDAGQIYFWDPETGSFLQHQGISETFDEIKVGDSQIWALRGTTAYLWDAETEQFEPADPSVAIAAFAVGKADDIAYAVGLDGTLLSYDYANGIFTLLSEDPGAANITELTASSGDNLWALDDAGVLYQLNFLNYEDTEASPIQFAEKSDALGLGGTALGQIAVDETGLLYSVNSDSLSFYDTEPARTQNALADQFYDVAISTDSTGRVHMAYGTDGAVFHSFRVNGEWVRSVPVPGSGQGSDIDIEFDDAGNVYVSWIQGVGNAAEVYVAKGAADTGYAGYVFDPPVQVTDDAVEDRYLDLEVTGDGKVTLTTSKNDAQFFHDDHDVYSYALDGNGSDFAPALQAEVTDPTGKVLEVSEIDHFLSTGRGLAGWRDPIDLSVPNGALTVVYGGEERWYNLNVTFGLLPWGVSGGDVVNKTGAEMSASFDFNKLLGDPAYLGDLKLTLLGQYGISVPSLAPAEYEFSASTGLGVSAYFDYLKKPKPDPDVVEIFDGALVGSGNPVPKFEIGGFLEFSGIWDALSASLGAAEDGGGLGSGSPGNPFTFIDLATGEPASPSSAPENIAATSTLIDAINWSLNSALAPFGLTIGSEAQTADESLPTPDPQGVQVNNFWDNNAFDIYFGLYTKGSWQPGLGKLFNKADVVASAQTGLELDLRVVPTNFPFLQPEKVGWRSIVDVQFNKKWSFRLLDLFIGGELGSEDTDGYALAPAGVAFLSGGSGAVYDDALAFEGNADGSVSDALDTSSFNYVLGTGSDGVIRAYGTYVRETEDPVSNSLNSLYTIEGIFDEETGKIVWLEETAAEIADSVGLNANPIITFQNPGELLIAWANVPESDPTVETLNQIPPGKAYLLFGKDISPGGSEDLAELGDDPAATERGFYYSNAQFDRYLYSIGAAVAQLGDVNTPGADGIPDFVFGAPDALAEAGRAYIIFGESYDTIADIDALDGENGFTLQGLTGDELGAAVSRGGDYNGDGLPDIAITAPGAFDHLGAVYVIYGGNEAAWSAGGGSFSVADVGGALPGLVIKGSTEYGRFGTSVTGGYDATGDQVDDLLIGAIYDGTATLISRLPESRVEIDIAPDVSSEFTGPETGNTDIGGSMAMLPDINEDGIGDLLIGSSTGEAYLLLGSERLASYSENYSVSWTPDSTQFGPSYQVLISFNGTDDNGDGILSAVSDEITDWLMEVYSNGDLDASYNLKQQLSQPDFDFNYDIAAGQVLLNSNERTNLENERYGIYLGDPPLASLPYQVQTVGISGTPSLGLFKWFNSFAPTLVASTRGLDNTLFDLLSEAQSYDLDSLTAYPDSGFKLNADTVLPLQVAQAGDVNGDGVGDLIVGYDQYTDEEGSEVNGRSYIVYGGSALTERSEALELDAMSASEGFAIDIAGGRVSAAGYVNDDIYADLLVSAPYATGPGDAARAGESYVIFGAADGYDADHFTVENANGYEASGSSLASLGDLDGDGRSELMIGAPQEPSIDDLETAQEALRLNYAERALDGGTWSAPALLNGGLPGEVPLALKDTARGTLALWVDAETDTEGNVFYALMGSFYDGAVWSATGSGTGPVAGQIGASTTNPITEATIAEYESTTDGSLLPLVVWIERQLDQNNSTTVLEATLAPDQTGAGWSWSAAAPVQPVRGEVPVVPPQNSAEVLSDDSAEVSVSDVHAREGDGTAYFTVLRGGDIDQESSVFQYRLFDYSAVHGVDYLADHTGSFSFAPGQSSHEIAVEILEDDLYEGGAPSRLRLEVWSDDPDVTAQGIGRAAGADRLTASLFIQDSSSILNLASIDSGFQLNGETEITLGYDFSPAGDVNGDGFGDFMIAAPNAGDDLTGKVYLLYGGAGVAIADQDLELDGLTAEQGVILTGTVEDGYAGLSLAAVSPEDAEGAATPIAIGMPGDLEKPSGGSVYLVSPDQLADTASLDLNNDNALRVRQTAQVAGDPTGDRFGIATHLGHLDDNTDLDLVVAARNSVYVVYDIFEQAGGTMGLLTISNNTNHTRITNSDGGTFGTGLEVADFDGDGHADLILGLAEENALRNVFDDVTGYGGAVAVIRGSEAGFGDSIDIADLGAAGFRLEGQAALTPDDINPPASPVDGSLLGAPRTGMPLLDGVGDAIAALDINGDGMLDLAIGAPDASFADATGLYTRDEANKGRVYVLFGGSDAKTNWSTLTGDYDLFDLYGATPTLEARAGDGVIFEGTESGGRAGSSVANLGAFRGAKNQEDGKSDFDDLAIGAPTVNSGAGQAYAVFGSRTSFGGHEAGSNVFALDPTVDPDDASALPIFTLDGQAQPLTLENTSNQGSLGYSVAGLGNIDATSFGTTNGTEFGIGAPRWNVDGVAKTFVATGAPWIVPGSALDAEDLRSDNGFIIPGDEPIPDDVSSGNRLGNMGDFDGDGYDDVWLLNNAQFDAAFSATSELRVVRGASIFDVETATDRVLSIDGDGVLSAHSVAAGDFDGDGLSEIISQNSFEDPGGAVYFDADNIDGEGNLERVPIDSLNTSGGSYVNYFAADFNGDGFDDLVQQSFLSTNSTSTANRFFLNSGDGTFSFTEIENVEAQFKTNPVSAIADLDGDGRDEIIGGWTEQSAEGAPVYSFNIGRFSDGSMDVADQFAWSDIADIPYLATADEVYEAVFLPSASGDVNNDGFEDLVLSATYNARPTETVKASLIVYGAADFSDISGTTITMAGESPISDDPFGNSPEKADEFRIKIADIVGDVNRDGFADILIADAASQDSFVVFGGEDLGKQINTPFKVDAGNFTGGYAIQSVSAGASDPEYLATTVSAAGDLNGDGVADFSLGDRHEGVDLAYAIYGELFSADADTDYFDGTAEDDIIFQSVDEDNPNATAVNIVTREGDDFVQTLGGYAALVYTGEGDDIIGLGGVTPPEILRIDGGSGWDKLFLDDVELGSRNQLDLTANRTKISNIEIIDLGSNNELRFDGPSIADITGPGNTLMLQGVPGDPSAAIRTDKTSWVKLGQDVYDGAIYEGFRYQTAEGTDSTYQVWIERGAVLWTTQALGTPESDRFTGTMEGDDLYGLEGDDTFLMRWGENSATGGAGADRFVIDARYVEAEDAHHILDFDGSQGDLIEFRFFDQTRLIRSEADLQFYIDNGYATLDAREGSALSLTFQNLDGNFGSDDEMFIGTRESDRFDGGDGDDRFLMRIGDDTATGGAGGDRFIFDARYVGTDSTHVVTDLDFDGGDTLMLRFFDAHPVTLTSQADLLALDAASYASVSQTGTRSDVTLVAPDGEIMQIELFQTAII